MKRSLLAPLALLLLVLMPARVHAAAYTGHITGSVAAYRLSGVEPDGDPLYQVALLLQIPASGAIPAATLVVSAYLENFSPDTTPVLPDLLHPSRTAQNLGGFLDGKSILVDDAGATMGTGIFLNEAFLDNTNHMTMSFIDQKGRVGGTLKGTFAIARKGSISGDLTGAMTVPASVVAQARSDRGKSMPSLKQIVNRVTVHPHYYGAKGVHATQPAYNTGFGGGSSNGSSAGGRHISPLTLAAGAGAVLSLLIAGLLYWMERRGRRPEPSL